jgi:hypothetical protein
LANTATLDAAARFDAATVGALSAVKTKCSNVTPVVVPVTVSATSAVPGATVVGVLALYAQPVQSKPPYTVTPSPADVTDCGVMNVPHAYTRLVAAFATVVALAIVKQGLAIVPQPVVSAPDGDTNVPYASATTHGSPDGSSVFGRHVVSHSVPPPW